MVEGYATKNKKSNGHLKDDSVLLSHDVESHLHDKPIEIYIWRNGNINKLLVNERNGAVLLKQLLGET